MLPDAHRKSTRVQDLTKNSDCCVTCENRWSLAHVKIKTLSLPWARISREITERCLGSATSRDRQKCLILRWDCVEYVERASFRIEYRSTWPRETNFTWNYRTGHRGRFVWHLVCATSHNRNKCSILRWDCVEYVEGPPSRTEHRSTWPRETPITTPTTQSSLRTSNLHRIPACTENTTQAKHNTTSRTLFLSSCCASTLKPEPSRLNTSPNVFRWTYRYEPADLFHERNHFRHREPQFGLRVRGHKPEAGQDVATAPQEIGAAVRGTPNVVARQAGIAVARPAPAPARHPADDRDGFLHPPGEAADRGEDGPRAGQGDGQDADGGNRAVFRLTEDLWCKICVRFLIGKETDIITCTRNYFYSLS